MPPKSSRHFALTASVFSLALVGWWIGAQPVSPGRSKSSPTGMTTVSFPDKYPSYFANSVLVDLEKVVHGMPDIGSVAIAFDLGQATILIHGASGTDLNAVVRDMEDRIRTVRQASPVAMEKEGVAIRTTVTSGLFQVTVHTSEDGRKPSSLNNETLVGLLSSINEVRGIGSASVLGHSRGAMWIRLDVDRMRTWNLSDDEVLQAIFGSTLVGNSRQLFELVHETPQSHEYVCTRVSRNDKPESYEDNVFLRAFPDGEVVRLRDIGEVQFGPFYSWTCRLDLDMIVHASATAVVTVLPGNPVGHVIHQVRQRLEKVKRDSFSPRVEFEIADELPGS